MEITIDVTEEEMARLKGFLTTGLAKKIRTAYEAKEPDITEHPLFQKMYDIIYECGLEEAYIDKIIKSLLEFMVCKSCGGRGTVLGYPRDTPCPECGKQGGEE